MIPVAVAFKSWTPLGERVLAGDRPLLPDDRIALFRDADGARYAVHGAELCGYADLDPLGMAHDAMRDAVELCVLGVEAAPVANGRVQLDRRHRVAVDGAVVDAPTRIGELDALVLHDVLAAGRADGDHRRAAFAAALGVSADHLRPAPWLTALARQAAWDPAAPTPLDRPSSPASPRRLYADLSTAGRARAARALAPLRETVLTTLSRRLRAGARRLATLSGGALAARDHWFDLGDGLVGQATGAEDGPLRWRHLALARDLPDLEEGWMVEALLGATVASTTTTEALPGRLESRGLGPRVGPALLARLGNGATLPPRAALRLREVAAPVWSAWVDAWWSEVDPEDAVSVRHAQRYQGLVEGLERLDLPALAERVRSRLATLATPTAPPAAGAEVSARPSDGLWRWSDDSILDVLVGEAGEVVSASARALLRRRPRVGHRWLGVWQDFLADLGEDVAWT